MICFILAGKELTAMLLWIETNLVSVILVLVLIAAVSLIVRSMILDRRAGKHLCGGSCGTCGGSCAGCPMHGKCHSIQNRK